MAWYDHLILITLVMSGMLVATSLRRWRSMRVRIAINLGILALVAVLVVAVGREAAAIAGTALTLLQFAVLRLGVVAVDRLVRAGRPAAAQRLLRLMRPLLGPMDALPPTILPAFDLLRREGPAACAAALDAVADDHSPDGRMARTLAYRVRGDEAGMLAWLERGEAEGWLGDYYQYPLVYLRCVAEVRGPEALLAVWPRMEAIIHAHAGATTENRARLIALSAAGDVDRILALTRDPRRLHLAAFDIGIIRAAAWQAAGDRDAAETVLRHQVDPAVTDNPFGQLIVQQYRHRALPAVSRPLSPALEARLTDWAGQICHYTRYHLSFEPLRRRPVTAALLAAITLLAGLTLAGDPQRIGERLARYGALLMLIDPGLPPLDRIHQAIGGQYWRILTTNLLHANVMHFVMNSLALLYFGPFVERFLGAWRTLLIYAACFVTGPTLVLILNTLIRIPADTIDAIGPSGQALHSTGVVGASVALMGAVGAGLVICWRGWTVNRCALARRELALLAGMIGIQTIVDLVVPNISFTGHLTGLLVGILLTLLLHRAPAPDIPGPGLRDALPPPPAPHDPAATRGWTPHHTGDPGPSPPHPADTVAMPAPPPAPRDAIK